MTTVISPLLECRRIYSIIVLEKDVPQNYGALKVCFFGYENKERVDILWNVNLGMEYQEGTLVSKNITAEELRFRLSAAHRAIKEAVKIENMIEPFIDQVDGQKFRVRFSIPKKLMVSTGETIIESLVYWFLASFSIALLNRKVLES